ncbi:glycosyltransferase [Candidatus Saccharibacteria bacterium]|nr:glycosyltransferase [Candidatus Saccharibacteria bacterium]
MKLISGQRNKDDVVAQELRNGQEEVATIENHLRSPTLMMLVLIAVLGALLYIWFLFNPANRGDFIPYVLVIVAESFLLSQVLLSLWTVLASGYDPRNYEFHAAQNRLFRKLKSVGETVQADMTLLPLQIHGRLITVDVFITTYGEEPAIIRRTAEAAAAMHGLHRTTILDDGSSDEVMKLAEELQIGYIRRNSNVGAKAGNINAALAKTNSEFFVIFDADFVPSKRFLFETLPFFENNNIAFVQTPQHYDNLNSTISRGAGYMQHVFYALIQPGKNRFNAAFCVGTNVVFRRSAVMDVGGMYQQSKSEDIWTSIKLHEKGYKSVYIPNILAVGKTPDTIKAYTKQQLRWATGGFEILFHANPLRNKNLTVDQKIQYFSTVTYYFNGVAALFLLLLPPLQIFLNLTPVNLHIPVFTWALFYSGFYLMQIFVAFYTMGGFRLQTLLLANASFPIYIKAMWNALFHREQAWRATGSIHKLDSAFNYIIPQVLFFIFLLGTSMVGIWKSVYTSQFSLSLFWNTVNVIVLGTFIFIAVRENHQQKRALRATDVPGKLLQGAHA